MILTDSAIADELEEGALEVYPFPEPEQVQPASLDITLSDEWTDPFSGNTYHREEAPLNQFDCVLATTQESFEIPNDLVAFVTGRSTMGRLFVTVHQTAGLIDPGYEGEVTLEIMNLGHEQQTLCTGDRVAQMYFHTTVGESSGYKGQYQNQRGPQTAGEI